MNIRRTNFNEIIANDIMNGSTPSYSNSKNGQKCWSLFKGRKGIYDHDTTDPRVTLILHRPHKSTYITLSCDYKEVAEYITNHEQNFEKFIEQDTKLGEYLQSEEGKWGL